jgi:hypothetical protein
VPTTLSRHKPQGVASDQERLENYARDYFNCENEINSRAVNATRKSSGRMRLWRGLGDGTKKEQRGNGNGQSIKVGAN